MRVLLVNDYATPTGGAEIGVLHLRDGLRARGHEARLFASRARPGGAAPLGDAYGAGTTSRWRTLLQTANPPAAAALAREIATFRPDVVHVNLFLTQLSPLILPVLRGAPAIFHAHWYRAVCPTGTKMLPDGGLCRVAAGRACLANRCLPLRDWTPLMLQQALWRRWRGVFGRFIANSEAVRAELAAAGFGPIEVIEYGVPDRPVRPPLAGPPTVFFAGRLVREKGVDILLRAFALVRAEITGARLVIAGEGPELGALAALALELGLGEAVEFTGRLDQEPLEARGREAWVQAAPSRWREPFGLVAVEAMLRGTAVVASRSGGWSGFVEHGATGLLVDGAAPQAWAAALGAVLGDPTRAEAMGRRGREVARARFDMDLFLDRMTAAYEGVRGEHAASTARPPPAGAAPLAYGGLG